MSESQRQIEENRLLLREEMDRQAAEQRRREAEDAERRNAQEWSN